MELLSGINLKNLVFMLKIGLTTTIYLSIIAITIGTLVGFIIGWLRTIVNEFFDGIILIFVDIIRSTPLIIQLLIAYHLPGFLGINITTISAGSIVIVLYFAVNCSQVVKAGIDSVTFFNSNIRFPPIPNPPLFFPKLGFFLQMPAYLG